MTDTTFDRAVAELDAFQRQCWEDDLLFREQAKTDPQMAALLADADAQYLAKNGIPWVNPLTQAAIA